MTYIESVKWVETEPTIRRRSLSPGLEEVAELGKLEAHHGAFEAHHGAYRVFPEALMPNQRSYNKVHAKVTLALAVPPGMHAIVNLKSFDPINMLHYEFNPDEGDNYGALVNWHNSLRFDASIPKTFPQHDDNTAQVQYYYGAINPAHAGDNYILAVHPNAVGLNSIRLTANKLNLERRHNDGGWVHLDENMESGILEVWRTLNVECDTMLYIDAPVPFVTPLITPPSPSDYLTGLVKEGLADACVVTKIFTPNPNQAPSPGRNPLTWIHEGWLLNGAPGVHSGRNISGNSHFFWTVRAVVSSRAPSGPRHNHLGTFYCGHNTIVLWYARIKEWLEEKGANLSGGAFDEIMQYIMLHEIGHVLLEGANTDHAFGGVIARCKKFAT